MLVVSADITLEVLSPYGRWLPLACRFSCVLDDVHTAARVSIGLMYGTQSCACWGDVLCVGTSSHQPCGFGCFSKLLFYPYLLRKPSAVVLHTAHHADSFVLHTCGLQLLASIIQQVVQRCAACW